MSAEQPQRPRRPRYTLDEFTAAAKAQAPTSDDVAFVCVRCGTVQSTRTFLAYQIPRTQADAAIGYACVGRYRGVPDGIGCDWTCGGLFGDLGRGMLVTTPDGREHTRFPFATRAEAEDVVARGGAAFKRQGSPEVPPDFR